MNNTLILRSEFLRSAAFALCLLMGASMSQTLAQSEKYLALADSADRYIEREKWKEAEKALTSALRLEPANRMNVMLLSNLGVTRSRLKDYKGALEAFDVAVAMSPESKSVRINRARTFLEINDEESALNDLDEVLRIDSIQEWSLRTRGMLLLRQKKYEAGIDDLCRHQRHYDADADLLTSLGMAYAVTGRDREAIEWYDKSIEASGTKEAWFARTLLKIQTDRLAEANDDLRRAIVIYPDFGDLYILRSIFKKKNHLLSEAEEDRKTAIRKGSSQTLYAELSKLLEEKN